MAMTAIPFIGASGAARSLSHDAQRTVNLYLETAQPGAKAERVLLGTPGYLLKHTLAAVSTPTDLVGIRGLHRYTVISGSTNQERLIAVSGHTVYVVWGTNVQSIGQIRGRGPVSIADNGTEVVIATNSGFMFSWDGNLANNVVGYTGMYGTAVEFLDGRFVYVKSDVPLNDYVYPALTGQFAISGLYSTTFNPADFATAEGSPDALVSMIVNHRDLWLFGTDTAEVWYNSGNPDFPFERNQGAVLEVGLAARFGVAKMDGSVFWITKDRNGQGTIVKSAGYQHQRVSNHAVEHSINSMSDISDCETWTYSEEGHSFVAFTFPTGDVTWVLDLSTGEWHERAWRAADNVLHRHRARCHAYMAGEHLIGDWENGNIYKMSLEYYSDNGAAIQRIRRSGYISGEKRMYHSRIEFDMEAGTATTEGDPQAMLSWSDDRGHSYKNTRFASFGKIGEYAKRVVFKRLGSSFGRVYELSITSSVKVAISRAFVHIT